MYSYSLIRMFAHYYHADVIENKKENLGIFETVQAGK